MKNWLNLVSYDSGFNPFIPLKLVFYCGYLIVLLCLTYYVKRSKKKIEEKNVEFFYVSGENLSNLPHCASLSQVI